MNDLAQVTDPYRAGESILHRMDARIKLVLTLAAILVSALLPNGAWAAYIMLAAGVWCWAVVSGLGVGFVLKRSLIAIPFALAALPLPFTLPSEVSWPVHILGLDFTIGQAGLVRLVSITLKSWLSVQAAILLTATTTLPALQIALKALRVPRLLVMVIGLMWRYMYVLADETSRLLRARSARSAAAEDTSRRAGGSLAWRAKVTGGMAGSLFIRSLERSERVYAAMLARGYDGTPRSLPQAGVARRDWLILLAGLLALALLLGVGLVLGGMPT
jgi:cobalt/nickel transport system permease protein